MEEKKAIRRFRGKATILNLLGQQVQSGQSIKSFCAAHGIAEGTFHNWKHRYTQGASVATGFTTLEIVPEPGLFAIVGSIKIFQPVSAGYLKDLMA